MTTGLRWMLVALMAVGIAGVAYAADSDGDSVDDAVDNCVLDANASQADADADGYGDACDADYNNDGVVDAADIGLIKAVFGAKTGDANYSPIYDHNGNGVIEINDMALSGRTNGQAPGPSGLACAGSSPCE